MTEVIFEQDLDTDDITLLDFEPAVPCEYQEPKGQCEKAAVWICTAACCGYKILLCQEHLDYLLDMLDAGDKFHHSSGPGACGARNIKKPFSHIERVNKSIGGS